MLYGIIFIQGLVILFLTEKLIKAKRELSSLKFDMFMRNVDRELNETVPDKITTQERILQ
jgi:hypothetical protein